MTIEMMSQIAIIRAKSPSYVTMRTTPSMGGKPSAVGGSIPPRKMQQYLSKYILSISVRIRRSHAVISLHIETLHSTQSIQHLLTNSLRFLAEAAFIHRKKIYFPPL